MVCGGDISGPPRGREKPVFYFPGEGEISILFFRGGRSQYFILQGREKPVFYSPGNEHLVRQCLHSLEPHNVLRTTLLKACIRWDGFVDPTGFFHIW